MKIAKTDTLLLWLLLLAGSISTIRSAESVAATGIDIPYQKFVLTNGLTLIPKIGGTRRQKVSDRVPQARLYKVWNVPAYGEAENVYLGLLADVLVSGKTSRLYKRLIY